MIDLISRRDIARRLPRDYCRLIRVRHSKRGFTFTLEPLRPCFAFHRALQEVDFARPLMTIDRAEMRAPRDSVKVAAARRFDQRRRAMPFASATESIFTAAFRRECLSRCRRDLMPRI